jgi:hypothetical protein
MDISVPYHAGSNRRNAVGSLIIQGLRAGKKMKRNFNCAEALNRRFRVVALSLCLLISATGNCWVRGTDYRGCGISFVNDIQQEGKDGILRHIQECIQTLLPLDPYPDLDRLRLALKSRQVDLWGKLDRQELKDAYARLPKGIDEKPLGLPYRNLFIGYASFEEKDLDRADKLVWAAAGLRYSLYEELPGKYAMQSLGFQRERYRECAELVGEMDAKDAVPYVQDLVGIAAATTIKYPELGREIGALLDRVLLRGVSACGNDAVKYRREKENLEAWRRSLIEFDQGDLAAPARFYAADLKVREALQTDDVIQRIERIIKSWDTIKRDLEEGAVLLHDRAKVWMPYKACSDVLMKLYETSGGLPVDACLRNQLMYGATKVLRRGVQVLLKENRGLTGAGDGLTNSQKILFARIVKHVNELKKELRYEEIARFAGEFAATPEVFDEADARQIFGEMARANYLLGRAYDYYLDRSNGLVTLGELEKLKQAKGRYIYPMGSKPCAAIDW